MTQTRADSDAQGDAQLKDMSQQITADAETLLRVMGRHTVSGASLARACDMLEGTLSRVLSGQYPITLRVVRALFEITGDAELVALLSTHEHIVVAVPSSGVARNADYERAFIEATQATNDTLTHAATLFKSATPSAAPKLLSQRIDRAIAALDSLRSAAHARKAGEAA